MLSQGQSSADPATTSLLYLLGSAWHSTAQHILHQVTRDDIIWGISARFLGGSTFTWRHEVCLSCLGLFIRIRRSPARP